MFWCLVSMYIFMSCAVHILMSLRAVVKIQTTSKNNYAAT